MSNARNAYDQSAQYIRAQIKPLLTVEGQIRMKLTAEAEGTNFLSITAAQLEAVQDALLTAEPEVVTDPVEDFRGLMVVPIGEGHTKTGLNVMWGDHRIVLTQIGENQGEGDITRTYAVSSDTLDMTHGYDAALAKAAIRYAFPAERCFHAHDCCGHLYRSYPRFLSEPLMRRILSHVQLVWEANI